MEIPHEFSLSIPQNSGSLLTDPLNFHMLLLQHPWKFHVLNSPVCILSGIAHLRTVQNICHFSNAFKDELKDHPNIKDWLLRCKDSCNFRIEELEKDSGIASAYGIEKSLCLNDLNYFHEIEGLPSDIAHDLFGSLALDVILDILYVLVEEKCLTL